MGGSVAAIENGYVHNEIAKSSYEYQTAIEKGEKVIVGVNKFTENEVSNTDILRIDDSIRVAQSEKLRALRARRNSVATNSALQQLKQTAMDGGNVMPVVIEAVEHYATLGEIADTLRNIYGEHQG